MKICYVGSLKPKFKLSVNYDIDEVIEVKWQILENLGMIIKQEEHSIASMLRNPDLKKMRLFLLKGGHELMDNDHMECAQGQQYLFYSFGKLFN